MTGRRDQQGFTLVELTVVLLVGSLVTFMMLNFLDNTSAVVGRSSARVQTEADARIALRTVLQDVRAAQSIATTYPTATACPTGVAYPSGFANCLRFNVVHATSSASICPYSMITYGLVGTTLKEDRVDYDASCTARTVFSGRTVLKNVTNGTRPVFTFADQYGNALSTSSSTTAAFAAAGTVTFNVFLQYQPRTPEISLFSTAALRNNR